MTDKTKKYLEWHSKEEIKKEQREELLKSMTNEEINYLISKSINIYEKIFMSKFKKKEDAK